MTVKAWCKEHEISIKTYYNWEKRFVEQTAQQAMPTAIQTGPLMRVDPDTLIDNTDEGAKASVAG